MGYTGIGAANEVYTGNGNDAGPSFKTPATSGTVTSVSVVSANGFAGTVANPTTTAAITLSTTQTGVLQGNGTAISAVTGADNGVLITGNTGTVSWLANSGTPGFILTANSGAPPSWQAAPASGIVTIDGTTGSVTGTTVSFLPSNIASINFSGSGTTMTLNPLNSFNNLALGGSVSVAHQHQVILGFSASSTGEGGIAIGYAPNAVSDNSIAIGTSASASGIDSIAIGRSTGITGAGAIAIGEGVEVTANYGVSIGYGSGGNAYDVVVGYGAFPGSGSAGYNICLGYQAGLSAINALSSSIFIQNQGSGSSVSNAIYIGTQGSSTAQQNKCFIAGIVSNTVSNSQFVTINSSTGQLGVSNGATTAWTDEGTNFNALSGNGYFITATCTATLPASPSQGDTIAFAVDAATTTVTITGNTGQIIRIGSAVSASAGTAANNARGDSVTLVYRSSDTAWIATSVIGTFTVT